VSGIKTSMPTTNGTPRRTARLAKKPAAPLRSMLRQTKSPETKNITCINCRKSSAQKISMPMKRSASTIGLASQA
jgi:hypothetical protein